MHWCNVDAFESAKLCCIHYVYHLINFVFLNLYNVYCVHRSALNVCFRCQIVCNRLSVVCLTWDVNYPLVVILGCREDIIQVFVHVGGHCNSCPLGHCHLSLWLTGCWYYTIHFMPNMGYAVECRHIVHLLQCAVREISDALPLACSASDTLLFMCNKMKKCRSWVVTCQ